jgi:hypothetical protein
VRAAEAQGQNMILQVVALVLGKFRGTTDKDSEMRSLLLQPILAHDAAVQECMAARRPIQDVDPETGELVEAMIEEMSDNLG